MTERSPIPPALSHLTQRDEAVRTRALEEAATVEPLDHRYELSAERLEAHMRGENNLRKAIRAMFLIPAPPSSAPDEAATRRHPAEMELDEIEGLLDQHMGPRWHGFRGPADALGVLLHENKATIRSVNRDRPTFEPGGMACEKCGCIFVGAESHRLCRVCHEDEAIRAELVAALRSLHFEATWLCKQLAARGLPGVPGDTVDRVMLAANAALAKAEALP